MICSRKDFGEMKNLNTDSVKNKFNDLFDTDSKKNQVSQKGKPKIAPKNFSILKTQKNIFFTNENNTKSNINLKKNEKTTEFCLNLPYQLKRKIKSKN